MENLATRTTVLNIQVDRLTSGHILEAQKDDDVASKTAIAATQSVKEMIISAILENTDILTYGDGKRPVIQSLTLNIQSTIYFEEEETKPMPCKSAAKAVSGDDDYDYEHFEALEAKIRKLAGSLSKRDWGARQRVKDILAEFEAKTVGELEHRDYEKCLEKLKAIV